MAPARPRGSRRRYAPPHHEDRLGGTRSFKSLIDMIRRDRERGLAVSSKNYWLIHILQLGPRRVRQPSRNEELTLHTHSWCAATRHYISDRKVSVSRVEARLLHLHSRSRKTRRAVLEPRDRLSVFALPNISCARSAGPIVIGPCLKTRSKRRSTQSHTVRWFVQPVERKLRRARRRLTMSCHFNTIIGRV